MTKPRTKGYILFIYQFLTICGEISGISPEMVYSPELNTTEMPSNAKSVKSHLANPNNHCQ